MNLEDMVSKEELLAEGWTARKIDAALDEADEFGASGHWLNTIGKPYYDRDRVAVAAYRVGLRSDEPLDAQWKAWANSTKPSALPLLSFDFHLLAKEAIRDSNERFSSLRLSHPVLGRVHGTCDREKLLIEEVLKKMVLKTTGVQLDSLQALMNFFSERAILASRVLGVHRPDGVVVRRAHRRTYISRATGEKSIHRFIDAVSLVHSGLVREQGDHNTELFDFLIRTPQFRFDIKCDLQPYRRPSETSPLANHHLLLQGELTVMPGRNESWSHFIRYGGDNRWELRTERTDFTGLSQLEPTTEVMGTTTLINWALHRDQELEEDRNEGLRALEDPGGYRDRSLLGPVASCLHVIARKLNVTFCVACLEGWLTGTWPPSEKEPTVRILDIKGITKRGVWIRIYHVVFDVETNLGPAYLYPPDADGRARLILKSNNSQSSVRTVVVPQSLLTTIDVLMPSLDLLKSQGMHTEFKPKSGESK